MTKFCSNCGKELLDNQEVCLNCGVLVNNNSNNITSSNGDSGNFGWFILGFFFPIIGLILYICFKNGRIKDAKQVGKGALASVILNLVLIVISIIFFSIFASRTDYNIYPDYYDGLKFD